jgi:phytoene/squalene synthetase
MPDSSATSFLLEHVRRVSTSFYLPIKRLRSPYREWIALSYLALRILDTIEDAQWSDSGDQWKSFALYEDFTRQPVSDDAILEWSHGFPNSLTTAEALLITDASRILAQLHALPAPARTVLQRTLLTMSSGMKVFLREKRHLASIPELDLYCFLVAGIVAELLVDLLAVAQPRFVVAPPTVLGARHFGVALQKINILKDVDADISQGRWFIFDRTEVEASLTRNVREALLFFTRLTPQGRELRLFCEWSLLLGLSSLDSRPLQREPRPAAEEGAQLVDRICDASGDPEAIENLVKELYPSFGEACRCPSDLVSTALEASAPEPLAGVLRGYFAESARARESD